MSDPLSEVIFTLGDMTEPHARPKVDKLYLVRTGAFTGSPARYTLCYGTKRDPEHSDWGAGLRRLDGGYEILLDEVTAWMELP